MSRRPLPSARSRGFTLIEVLVALGVTAVTLLAGFQAMQALTRQSMRQDLSLLGQLCAENALIAARLHNELPAVGDHPQRCVQGPVTLPLLLVVRPTPNPSFRRVDAVVSDTNGWGVTRVSTVIGRR